MATAFERFDDDRHIVCGVVISWMDCAYGASMVMRERDVLCYYLWDRRQRQQSQAAFEDHVRLLHTWLKALAGYFKDTIGVDQKGRVSLYCAFSL